MQSNLYIPNNKYCILSFYLDKLSRLGLTGIFCLFACRGYQEAEAGWYFYGILSLIMLWAADIVAMPIARSGDVFTFHHLWRQSTLDVSDIRFLWLSGGGILKIYQRSGDQLMVALGKYPWNVYYVNCNKNNTLLDTLYDCETT